MLVVLLGMSGRGREVTWLEFLCRPMKQLLSDEHIVASFFFFKFEKRTLFSFSTRWCPWSTGMHHNGQTLTLIPTAKFGHRKQHRFHSSGSSRAIKPMYTFTTTSAGSEHTLLSTHKPVKTLFRGTFLSKRLPTTTAAPEDLPDELVLDMRQGSECLNSVKNPCLLDTYLRSS